MHEDSDRLQVVLFSTQAFGPAEEANAKEQDENESIIRGISAEGEAEGEGDEEAPDWEIVLSECGPGRLVPVRDD
jgi:hypothetical protein